MGAGQQTQQPGPAGPGAGRPGPQLQSAPVDEILESDVVTVERDAPIDQVVERMASEDVGSVVVTEDDEPVGVLTDRTIALSLGETPDVTERTAGEMISGDLVTGTTEMTVFDVLERLEEASIRRLPVVDEDGDLAGIVTLDDVVVLLNAELSDVASIIESQSPRF